MLLKDPAVPFTTLLASDICLLKTFVDFRSKRTTASRDYKTD